VNAHFAQYTTVIILGDTVEVISSMATIIGLLSNFKSERRATSDDEYKEFVEWLDKKRHTAVIEEINSNHLLGMGIKALLNRNHESVINKLSILDDSLVTLASQIDGFKEIASAISKHSELSDQAISIVKQLIASGGSIFLEIKMKGISMFQVMDASGSIEYDDPRFLDDDLKQLCKLELLIPSTNKSNGRVFNLTRFAVKYIDQLES